MRFFLLLSFLGNIYLSSAQTYFPPIVGSAWDTTSPQDFDWCQPKINDLYSFLDSNDTKAFILMIDGKIVLEKYFDSHTFNTPWYWASAGKTLTAFMVGMAQQEGFLSIQDTTSIYLGQGWTSCTLEQEDNIKIVHQLSMTSGLDDSGASGCILPSCLTYVADPNTRWAYHNGPYTLLDSLIEVATGITLNDYTTTRVKNQIGMTGSYVQIAENNVFFSNARSMARFGLLMLNEGTWNGNHIMTDSQYFNEMINTSQAINESYGYLWWLNGGNSFHLPSSQLEFSGSIIPNAPDDLYMALGKNGQFINVVPSQKMVWIRMGNEPTSAPVPYLMNLQIWDYINDLECSVGFNEAEKSILKIYPNPTNDRITISSDKVITKLEIIDLKGRIIETKALNTKSIDFSIQTFNDGIYYAKITFDDGIQVVQKIFID